MPFDTEDAGWPGRAQAHPDINYALFIEFQKIE